MTVNPVAILMIIIGGMLMVIAFKGRVNNLVAAGIGKEWGGSTLK